MLTKIHIENFRALQKFDLEFNEGLNVLVGANDAGKSTLLEATYLVLTSRYRRRPLAYELFPHMINKEAAGDYLASLETETPEQPPKELSAYIAIHHPKVLRWDRRRSTQGFEAINIGCRRAAPLTEC